MADGLEEQAMEAARKALFDAWSGGDYDEAMSLARAAIGAYHSAFVDATPAMNRESLVAGLDEAKSLIIGMKGKLDRLTEADKRWGELHQRVIEERAEALRQIKAFAPFIALAERWPVGTHLTVEHDGFVGTVVGYYITREGKPGLDLQLDNAKVVHVYGEKWFEERDDE